MMLSSSDIEYLRPFFIIVRTTEFGWPNTIIADNVDFVYKFKGKYTLSTWEATYFHYTDFDLLLP